MKSKFDTCKSSINQKTTFVDDFSDTISEKIGVIMHRFCQDNHILALCDNIGDRLEYTMEYFCKRERRQTSYLGYNDKISYILYDDGNLAKVKFIVRKLENGDFEVKFEFLDTENK